MTTNLIDEASQIYSNLVLDHYYQNIAKVFDVAPLYISDSMIVRTIKKTTDPLTDTTKNTTKGLTSNPTVQHSELSFVETELKGRAVEEVIPIDTHLIGKEINFDIAEAAMVDCAYRLGADLMYDLDTLLTTAGTFENTIDLSGGSYTQWSTAATCTPRADVEELKGDLCDSFGCDIDDPRLTAIMSKDVYDLIINSTAYTNYKPEWALICQKQM